MANPDVQRRERAQHRLAAWVTGLLMTAGFLLLPPSCGKLPMNECAKTCSGCCNAAGECVTTESDKQCGKSGLACDDCSKTGNICHPTVHQCTGGNGDAGSCASTCPGCCFNGICLPFSAQVPMSCGTGGAACRACSTGNTCTMGACVPEAPSITGIPCFSDTECLALGSGAICKKVTSNLKYQYPEGFCSRPCTSSTGCAWDAVCARAPEEMDALCMPQCDDPNTISTCRDGYLCVGLTVGTGGACWLLEPFLPDAGPALDKTGRACMNNAMCDPTASANGTGLCIPETLKDGGPSGFTGGYCTGDCTMDPRICSNDGGAVCISSGGQSYSCARSCNGPSAGQSDCRQGYVCYGVVVRTADGGTRPSATGVCQPSCQVMGGLFACANGAYCDAGYCVQ